MEKEEYILGTDPAELARLGFQHTVWVQQAYALFERADFRAGDALLDLGCGPGFTTLELAHVVGPEGRVVARDKSRRFIATLKKECERRGWTHVDARVGSAEQLDLPAASLDGAYARWLFSWLDEPGAALARVAAAVKPGGTIALQEYIDWGAVSLLPESAPFQRAVQACLQSFHQGEARIDVGRVLPELARGLGLELATPRPLARIGEVGSLEWRWLGGFFHGYLPRLIERRLFTAEDLTAFREDWAERTRTGNGYCCTPTMADFLFRKPGSAAR